MELTENHLMEFISTETKMESLQNNTRFHKTSSRYLRF
jgi:hypothetical protein